MRFLESPFATKRINRANHCHLISQCDSLCHSQSGELALISIAIPYHLSWAEIKRPRILCWLERSPKSEILAIQSVRF